MDSLAQAVQALHDKYRVPHVVITSVALPDRNQQSSSTMAVVGSTRTSNLRARLFKILFPAIDCYFSGTGDMFAALMVVRLREVVAEGGAAEAEAAAAAVGAGNHNHHNNGAPAAATATTTSTVAAAADPAQHSDSWLSDDSVAAVDLPLARAAERVLASMHEVLSATREALDVRVARADASLPRPNLSAADVDDEANKKRLTVIKSRAAELRLVRHLKSLTCPTARFRAVAL